MQEKRNQGVRSSHTRRLVTAALFAAICFGMTMLSVPLPVVGYGNLGDCFVLLSGWLLGPLWGAAAAGVGTALADVTLGYGVYAPATFVIKALMAVTVYFMGSLLSGSSTCVKRRLFAHVAAAACGEVLMVCGYFVYESLLFGVATATASLLGNGVQATAGIVISTVMIAVIRGNKALNEMFIKEK